MKDVNVSGASEGQHCTDTAMGKKQKKQNDKGWI